MGNDVPQLSTSVVTSLADDSNGRSIATDTAPAGASFEVKATWSPLVDSPETYQKGYTLAFVDVDISVQTTVGVDGSALVESDGLKDLLTTVQSSGSLSRETSWSGRVLLVLPTRSGYLARTTVFQHRFTGRADLGVICDRTVVGQHLTLVDSKEFQAILDGSVLMLVRSADDSHLSDDTAVLQEVDARINFQWLLKKHQPQQKTLALVDGHLNLASYLPLYRSATALGVKIVLLESPTHWIRDPSLRHLYTDFVPLDMTPDAEFHERIAAAVRAYGHVDGICAIASYCLVPVARAATALGLPAESPDAMALAINKYETRLLAGGAPPTTLATDVPDLKNQIAEGAFVPRYPLIVKPSVGTGSDHVYKVSTEAELLEGVRRTSEGSRRKVLIEAYIDGPELDVNFVLLDGEILFYEISDDFPSAGDAGTIDDDFLENTTVLPSNLPAEEYQIVREQMHQLLLRLGLKTGVFHLEARVQDSSMAFLEKDGFVDLRRRPGVQTIDRTPRAVLIEVNPRPPGFQSVYATAGAYGVSMYDAHVLASLGDYERYRALARPFELDPAFPNHARVWSQIVFLRADKGGICASDDACGELLQRLPPEERALVTEAACFYRRGQRIPEPKAGVVRFGAYFVVTSRRDRQEILRVSRVLQQQFSIPVNPV